MEDNTSNSVSSRQACEGQFDDCLDHVITDSQSCTSTSGFWENRSGPLESLILEKAKIETKLASESPSNYGTSQMTLLSCEHVRIFWGREHVNFLTEVSWVEFASIVLKAQ